MWNEWNDMISRCVSFMCFFFFPFSFHLGWEFVYFYCRYGDLVYYFVPISVLVIDKYDMSYELHDLIRILGSKVICLGKARNYLNQEGETSAGCVAVYFCY